MAHVRTEIRNALVEILKGLDSTRDRVFKSRVRPYNDKELPALNLVGGDEELETADLADTFDRKMAIEIEIHVKASDEYDEVIDQCLLELETVLGLEANRTLGGYVHYVQPQSIEVTYSKEGDKPVAFASVVLEVRYFTALGAPDVSLL